MYTKRIVPDPKESNTYSNKQLFYIISKHGTEVQTYCTRINPAFAVANCVKIHSSTFGPQMPTLSPFLRPSARKPAASFSACTRIMKT